jgi:hypothetical protein
MLFLLNDVVLTIDLEELASPQIVQSLRTMNLNQILHLGREMFAEAPRLQHLAQSGPLRLATLITAKQPDINAALFAAPAVGCAPEAVTCRFASLGIELIHDLKGFQDRHLMNKVLADFHVWGRLRAAVA